MTWRRTGTVSDDGLEWTFTLRDGVTFHNGDPFTAADVVYTFERSSDPEQSIHSGVLANVTSVEAVDDLTVKFVLAQPQASFLVEDAGAGQRPRDDHCQQARHRGRWAPSSTA